MSPRRTSHDTRVPGCGAASAASATSAFCADAPRPATTTCLPGVPGRRRRAVEVGDAVADAVGVLGLARGGVAVATERVRRAPGAGGVDDGARGQRSRRGGGDVHGERHLVAADRDQPVATLPGHADHPVAVAHLDARPAPSRSASGAR